MMIQPIKRTNSIKQDQRGYGVIAGLISLLAGLLLIVVGLRFLFRLLGANANNAFVNWIYSVSHPFVSPFFGIFNHDVNTVTGGRFEWETLIAFIVYGLIAAVVIRALSWPMRRRPVVTE